MIVRDQPSSLALFVAMQGSIVPRIWHKIVGIAVLSVAVLLIDAHLMPLPHISIAAMGVFGVALSLFLGFRNNAAYDRWWEARKLWGAMIADIRNLGRNASIFLNDAQDRRKLMTMAAAFAHFHRGQLRRVDATEAAQNWIGAEEAQHMARAKSPADAALRGIAKHVGTIGRDGRLGDIGQMTFAQTLSSLALAQAGAERIANTPLPFVYSLLVRRTTYLYCWLLPFALIDSTHMFAPVFAAVVAYVFFGLQAVTNELEQPFSNVQNGLPLDAMCRTIEISVAEALGDTPPEPLAAQGFVLS